MQPAFRLLLYSTAPHLMQAFSSDRLIFIDPACRTTLYGRSCKVAIKRATQVVVMAQSTYQNLIDENQRWREGNRQLRMRVDTLEAQVWKFPALLEQAQRTGRRQAAPSSKGTPKQDPKRRGGSRESTMVPRPIALEKWAIAIVTALTR